MSPFHRLAPLFVIAAVAFVLDHASAFSLGGNSGRSPVSSNTASLGASGFVARKSPLSGSRSRSPTSQRSSSTSLSMVIDKLSDECIGAVKEAHNFGNEIGLQVLRHEILFAGIIAKPEGARRAIKNYGMKQISVRNSVMKVLKAKPGIDLISGGNEDREAPLPFSDETKKVLSKALDIATTMESPVVRSEHVLLALMGYNEGKKIQKSPVIEVLTEMDGIGYRDEPFTLYHFCEEIVNDIKTADYVIENEEVVVIGGESGSTNTLKEVGVDMTQLALDGKLDAVYGRETEIRSALRTLGRRRKNNPCLVGDPGVGKTAVAEGIAQVLAGPLAQIEESKEKKRFKIPKIRNPFRKEAQADEDTNGSFFEEVDTTLPDCPKQLAGSRLISIELASLVAGTRNRGDFEEKVKKLIEEASNSNVILFIDEIHNLIGTGGGGDGAMNAANLLKPALARGELRVLGATTTSEYRRYIEKDGALERRFQPLQVDEPTVDETLDILSAVMPKYMEYHEVEYTWNALASAAKLSDRYISDRFLPDKAIDLLDEAGSMVKMSEGTENFFVTEDSVAEVVSEISGIPVGKLDTGEKERLQNLEAAMEERIKGQTPAVRAVAKSIRRARSGMRDGKRPVASLLFCGPTGVGKTELCKALAETYFGQEKDMIRIDMSEYMDRFSTSRLVGAPPGYVGYDEGGQLTEAVRRAPHSVVLFDELEKAHEDVLNILLQIMDEGTLTDGKGRTVNFKNTIFVMTSNVGSQQLLEVAKERVEDTNDNVVAVVDQMTAVVKDALEDAMRPELLNRIDEIVVFAPLAYDNLKAIATNLVAAATKRAAADQDMTLSVSDNVIEMITREALKVSGMYGARPIRRAVQRYVEDPMAEAIMSSFVNEGDQVRMTVKDGNTDKPAVKISHMSGGNGSSSSSTDRSLIIPVDDDAGISSKDSMDFQASYGDLPSLDDPPTQEPDAFQ